MTTAVRHPSPIGVLTFNPTPNPGPGRAWLVTCRDAHHGDEHFTCTARVTATSDGLHVFVDNLNRATGRAARAASDDASITAITSAYLALRANGALTPENEPQ